MKRTRIVAAGAAAALLAATGSALACGDGWMGTNLVAGAKVKAALQDAYAGQTGVRATLVPGSTFYGDYSGTKYAVARFALASGASTPVVLATDLRGRWHVRRVTHGAVCTNAVPIDLIRGAWFFTHWNRGCYLPPDV